MNNLYLTHNRDIQIYSVGNTNANVYDEAYRPTCKNESFYVLETYDNGSQSIEVSRDLSVYEPCRCTQNLVSLPRPWPLHV